MAGATAESEAALPLPMEPHASSDAAAAVKDLVGDDMRKLIREELARAFADHGFTPATSTGRLGELESSCLEIDEPTFYSEARPAGADTQDDMDPIGDIVQNNFSELARQHMKQPLPQSSSSDFKKIMSGKVPGGEMVDSCLYRSLHQFAVAEPPDRDDSVSRVADHWFFHTLMSFVIVLNSMFLWFEANEAMVHAEDGDFRDQMIPYHYVDTTFLIVYILELSINLWRQRLVFFYGVRLAQNWLDLSLVVLGLLSLMEESVLPGSNALKILRVCKLVKALRVLRAITMVKTLRALLASLIASISTLFGAFIMLGLTIYMWALLFVLGIANYFETEGDTVAEAERLGLIAKYGSVEGAMVSLLKATTDGWSLYYDVLEPAGWLYQALFVTFVLFTQIALMNIILGLFVDHALKSMISERDELAREHEAVERRTMNDIMSLFEESSCGHSGRISQQEWDEAIDNGRGKLHSYLHMLGFRLKDVNGFFKSWISMSKEGTVDIQQFVEGCMSMKGNASHFDIKQLEFTIHELGRVLRPVVRRNRWCR